MSEWKRISQRRYTRRFNDEIRAEVKGGSWVVRVGKENDIHGEVPFPDVVDMRHVIDVVEAFVRGYLCGSDQVKVEKKKGGARKKRPFRMFCPRCEGAWSVEKVPTTPRVKCPRCYELIDAGDLGIKNLDGCPKCGGTYPIDQVDGPCPECVAKTRTTTTGAPRHQGPLDDPLRHQGPVTQGIAIDRFWEFFGERVTPGSNVFLLPRGLRDPRHIYMANGLRLMDTEGVKESLRGQEIGPCHVFFVDPSPKELWGTHECFCVFIGEQHPQNLWVSVQWPPNEVATERLGEPPGNHVALLLKMPDEVDND